jgi:small acid-soluble spore protein D (minor alpha/beta-type SASP)
MASNNNRVLVPEARNGLNKFKMEIANGVGLSNYEAVDKGNLTSRQNGSVGGEMVKRMVEAYEKNL